MIATENGQSVADFARNAAETLERIGRTGEPEVLTVDGEVRAVLVSPAVYQRMADEMRSAEDADRLRKGLKDVDEGRTQEAGEFFAELRSELLAMRDAPARAGAK